MSEWQIRDEVEPELMQIEGVERILQDRRLILADTPGSGKTLQSLIACKEFGAKRVLVVGPPVSAQEVWPGEITKHTTATYRTVDAKNRDGSIRNANENFLLIHYQAFIRSVELLKKYNPDVIIFDEAHALINRGTDSFKMAMNVSQALLNRPLILLTGTPVVNSGADYWALIRILFPKDVFSRSYWRWVDYWFEITELNFGQKTYKVKKIGKIKDEERFQQYLSKFVLRRDIELDVEKHTHEVFSSLDEETRRAYVSMNRHMFCELPNGEIVNATNAATQLGRLRQLTISWQLLSSDPPEPLIGGKADDCVRIVNEDDTKVLVFSFYTGALERLHMRFEQEGIVSDLIVGKVKVHERLEKIRKFRSDPSIKVLLIQTKIAGSSITLNEAKRVIMLNDDYAPANDDQAHRRAYRKGQTEDINVYRLLAQKTVDTYNIRIIRDTKLSLYQALVSALEDQEILE